MALIVSIPIEEVLAKSKQPSARALRTHAIAENVEAIVAAIQSEGAATIAFADEERPDRYYAGLRAALQRKGYTDILMRKKHGLDQAVAWRMREEDRARVEARRRTGLRLAQVAKQRAAKRRVAKSRGRRKVS
jgi:hypothetical protein